MNANNRLPSWIEMLVGRCVALGALSMLITMCGVIITVGVSVSAFPMWLGPSILALGLALFLVFLVGIFVARSQLHRLMLL